MTPDTLALVLLAVFVLGVLRWAYLKLEKLR